ncbi:prokineticin receptor 2-like [Ptychodera flava]|uniref:prokineticin receptor 2-like n=1 Tax=Ptychodera flava TaxID=63121 RepID=UPI00396A7032
MAFALGVHMGLNGSYGDAISNGKACQTDYYADYGNYPDTYYLCGASNDTYNGYLAFPELSVGVKALVGIVYTLTIAVCGVGNVLLCYVIYRFRRMRTTTNLLIGNLALSDFILALVCAPFNFYYYINQNWPFGNFICIVVSFVKPLSLYVSTNSLLAIAVDRYFIIMNPLKPRMGICKAMVVVATTWIVSIAVSLPSAIHSGTWQYPGSVHCGEIRWKSPKALQINNLFLIVSEFVVPLIIITVAYSIIARKLWFRQIPGSRGQLTQSQEVAVEESKRKSIRMLIIVVVLFALCWIPYYVYGILRDFFWINKFGTMEDIKHHLTIFCIVETIAMSNSMFNTFIYVVFNANFRKYVSQIPEICRRSRDRGSIRHVSCLSNTSHRFRSTIELEQMASQDGSKATEISCDTIFTANGC